MTTRDSARQHLGVLATEPRPAGSDAEARARRHCATVLGEAGFTVREEAFEYSALPGRFATSAFGVSAIAGLAVISGLGAAGRPLAAAFALLGMAAILAAAGLWVARYAVSGLRVMRRRSVNLIARRGLPVLWLVAHLDSKSQPVPMLLRAGGIVLTAVLWIGTLVVALAQVLGAPVEAWWPWIGTAGAIAGAPIVASVVGARSPGAIDDASGVATVLLAAAGERDIPIGVALTSAEELGLAGARAWARSVAPGIAINCDGVDDTGPVTAMYSGRAPTRLLEAFAVAADAAGVGARSHRLIPGILVDGVALADAGWEVITISRGTLRTLRRIHTPADSMERLRGDGVADVAGVMRNLIRSLAGSSASDRMAR